MQADMLMCCMAGVGQSADIISMTESRLTGQPHYARAYRLAMVSCACSDSGNLASDWSRKSELVTSLSGNC